MWLRQFAGQHHHSAWVCGAIASLLLSACSGSNPPSTALNTPTSTMPIQTSTPLPTNSSPSPGLAGPAPVPEQNVDRTGSYAGTAVPLSTSGGACLNSVDVKGFHVRGNAARFGGYRGTIDANNGVQMVYGTNWLIGQFEGTTFHGQLDLTQRFGADCTYMLTLQRVGP